MLPLIQGWLSAAPRCAHGIGHVSAASADRPWRARRCIAGRLVLHLSVQFSAEQNDDSRDPEPRHQSDGRSERTVGLVEGA
jgi:hypothetical protein